MRNLPPLSYLQAFEAAARHLSFTEAAKELNCTQAAISQRVRGLEQYLSRQLFSRKANGLELSEAGEAYLPGVTEALDIAASATEGLNGAKIRKTVTISAPLSFVTLWLTPRLPAFYRETNEIELRVNSSIWTDPNVELADVRVEVRDGAEADAQLPRLAAEKIMLVCAPSQLEKFSNFTLQGAIDNSRRLYIQGNHHLWERWTKAKDVQLDRKTPPIKFDNSLSALEAVAQGLGVAVCLSNYAIPYQQSGRLVSPDDTEVSTNLSHVLMRPAVRPPWHPSHRLYQWLRQEFEKGG